MRPADLIDQIVKLHGVEFDAYAAAIVAAAESVYANGSPCTSDDAAARAAREVFDERVTAISRDAVRIVETLTPEQAESIFLARPNPFAINDMLATRNMVEAATDADGGAYNPRNNPIAECEAPPALCCGGPGASATCLAGAADAEAERFANDALSLTIAYGLADGGLSVEGAAQAASMLTESSRVRTAAPFPLPPSRRARAARARQEA